jgi:hypothetical protein
MAVHCSGTLCMTHETRSWRTSCTPAGPNCFPRGRHQCISSKGSSPQGAHRAGAGHARQAVSIAGGTSLQQRLSWGWCCGQFSSCCSRQQASAGRWQLPQWPSHPGGPQQSSGGSIPEVSQYGQVMRLSGSMISCSCCWDALRQPRSQLPEVPRCMHSM